MIWPLAARSPVQAQVVKLRFFVGMTAAESAEVLGLSERTVKQYWSHAKTWLYREIQSKRAESLEVRGSRRSPLPKAPNSGRGERRKPLIPELLT